MSSPRWRDHWCRMKESGVGRWEVCPRRTGTVEPQPGSGLVRRNRARREWAMIGCFSHDPLSARRCQYSSSITETTPCVLTQHFSIMQQEIVALVHLGPPRESRLPGRRRADLAGSGLGRSEYLSYGGLDDDDLRTGMHRLASGVLEPVERDLETNAGGFQSHDCDRSHRSTGR